MPADLVADDDQPKIPVDGVALQFSLQDGKGLHQPRDVLLPADGAHIQEVWVLDLVALQNAQPNRVVRRRPVLQELGIRCVVDLANPVRRRAEQVLDIAPRGVGNSHHSGSALQAPPELVEPEAAVAGGHLIEQQAAHVVHGDHIWPGHEQGNGVERDMANVGPKTPQKEGKGDLVKKRRIRPAIDGDLEIRGQLAQFLSVGLATDQRVVVLTIQFG